MKKFLYTLTAFLLFSGVAYAGYNLSTESFPDGNNASAPYTVVIEDTAADVLATDYVPLYRTTTKTAELIAANKIQGLGAAKAISFTDATVTGDVIGDGADQLYGFRQEQTASTTTAITVSQCGSSFVSNSADVITLPEASTALGCRYTFVCGTADDFDINPADGTDAFTSISTTNGTTAVVTLAPSAGDAIRCTDIGGSITIEAIGANAWAQVGGGNGIWTDVN
jgi:hypothetical protein